MSRISTNYGLKLVTIRVIRVSVIYKIRLYQYGKY